MTERSRTQQILVYVPSRRIEVGADGVSPPGGVAVPGMVQRARLLGVTIDAMATIGDRVVLVLAPQASGSLASGSGAGDQAGRDTMRRVLALRAVRSPAAAVWYFNPGDGMDTLPPIFSGDPVVALVAETGRMFAPGPPAVLAQLGSGNASDRFIRLGRLAWEPVEVDEAGMTALDRGIAEWLGADIHAAPDDIRVRMLDGPSWLVEHDGRWALVAESTSINATVTQLAAPRDGIDPLASGVIVFPSPAGLTVLAERDGRVALASWDASGWYPSGAQIAARDHWAAATIDSGSRVAVLASTMPTSDSMAPDSVTTDSTAPDSTATGIRTSHTPAGADGSAGAQASQGQAVYELTELSTNTGEVLYQGDIVKPRAIPVIAMQVLLVGLLALTGVALFVALRPDPLDGAVPLPEGVALASHAQRVLAQVIDFTVAITFASFVVGTPIARVFTWDAWLTTGEGWLMLPVAFLVLWTHAVTMDAMVGGTIGRVLTGTRVVRLEPAEMIDQDGRRHSGAGPDARDDTDAPATTHSASGGRAPRPPTLWQAIVRNTIKLCLPPIALMMLIDPSGRHRAEQLSRTAVVVRLEPSEP